MPVEGAIEIGMEGVESVEGGGEGLLQAGKGEGGCVWVCGGGVRGEMWGGGRGRKGEVPSAIWSRAFWRREIIWSIPSGTLERLDFFSRRSKSAVMASMVGAGGAWDSS